MNNQKLMKIAYGALLAIALIIAILGLLWTARRSPGRRPIWDPVANERNHRTTSRRATANQDAAIIAVGDLVFSDANTAWLLNHEGNLLITRDAGETWVPIGGEITKTFDAFSIADGFRGLAADDEGRIWKTDDGGNVWYPVSMLHRESAGEFYHGASEVLLADNGKGWVVDTFAVWQTQDNGSSWHENRDLSNPNQPERVWRINFLDPNKGWAICDAGLIFNTIDGGNHWYPANGNLSFDRGTTPETIKFLDDNHGWLSVTDAPQPYPERVVLFTEDGGKTWRQQKEISNRVSIYQIFFLNSNIGWMAGGEFQSDDEETGILFSTGDGGKSWRKVKTIPVRDPIRSVRFFSDFEGWLTTDYDVYRTHDGGKSWASVLSYPEVRERNMRLLGSSETTTKNK